MPRSLFPAATPETRSRLERNPTLKLINEFDWSANPLGPIPDWPQSLKGAVRVMMAAPTPMVMLIGEQGILVYNDAYADFAGGRHPAIFGLPAVEAWPEIADFNRDKIALGLSGGSLILRDQELVLNRHGQLESGWMDLHYSPILDEAGQPMGTLCIVHETTDRIMAEQALARSEERLSLALSGSNLVGTWDWDVPENRVTADDRFAAMFNIDSLRAGLGVPVETFLNAIHPDDVQRVNEAIAASLRDGSALHVDCRVVALDGGVRWLIASGQPRTDGSGRVLRLPGVAVDVTEQRRVTEALAESELRFRTLADTMPQMVWSALPDGYHDYYNARWYEFTGVAAGSSDGDGWKELLHPKDSERVSAAWRESLRTGEPYQVEYRLRHLGGDYLWTLALALPIRDAAGNIVRWFGTCTEIHETRLAAEERELVAQELSHRIKNIFAVLTGIISLSARSRPEVRDFAEELRQRIYALGEAHDFVRPHGPASRATENQGSLRGLIDRLLQPYRRDGREPVEFAGDDAQIDDGAATPLALLFHELATNAAKYGALTAAEGRVVITGHAAPDRYHLSWKELGGPPVTSSSDLDGFGTRLVTLSVEGQLRGTIERVWEADGLRVEIGLPLDALRRSARLQRQDG